MELPELSLAPTSCRLTLECSSSSESSDTSSSRKRKALTDGFLENKSFQAHRSIDLQHSNERLPLDWEQCLDLESGKMYFLNRKTLKRSWDRPMANDKHHDHLQKLGLELNISSPAAAQAINKPKPASVLTKNSHSKKWEVIGKGEAFQMARKHDHLHSPLLANYSNNKEQMLSDNNNNMVAMACLNCHLLVIVSKTSPTCPNCKHVHSVPPAQQISPAATKPTIKPLDTLSLFS
uniref:WW domain-containing protein n=1 Tax=Kalanchoe fedtschenkoi TaxID=63787 RepID=A0A7N0USA7_KALFE